MLILVLPTWQKCGGRESERGEYLHEWLILSSHIMHYFVTTGSKKIQMRGVLQRDVPASSHL